MVSSLFADQVSLLALGWLDDNLLIAFFQNETLDVSENIERSIKRSDDGTFWT